MRRIACAFATFVFATPAFADKIDGDWCSSDGRHFQILGPEIVTHEGRKVTGVYHRHYFAYIVPAPEANGGTRVQMALSDEMTLLLAVGEQKDVETWKRCGPTS